MNDTQIGSKDMLLFFAAMRTCYYVCISTSLCTVQAKEAPPYTDFL